MLTISSVDAACTGEIADCPMAKSKAIAEKMLLSNTIEPKVLEPNLYITMDACSRAAEHIAASIIQGDDQKPLNNLPNGVVVVNAMAIHAQNDRKRQETEGCDCNQKIMGIYCSKHLIIRIRLVGQTFKV